MANLDKRGVVMTVLQEVKYERRFSFFRNDNAFPILKWAGGKRQLLPVIHKNLPSEIYKGKITTYIEPFFGGGAVFFSLTNNFTFLSKTILDINKALVFFYKNLRDNVEPLIELLTDIQKTYDSLNDAERENYYYNQRDLYNKDISHIYSQNTISDWLYPSAQLLFLNKTGFNGLYRVNSSGEFNVPFGSYKNPRICDVSNLRASSKALEHSAIIHGDFELSLKEIDHESFVYLDPPYRPLSTTSSFNSYAKESFDDSDQIRLAEFCKSINAIGAKFLLSNSDPKNIDPNDNFFDELYKGFTIKRINARRNINSDGSGRGIVSELLIKNY